MPYIATFTPEVEPVSSTTPVSLTYLDAVTLFLPNNPANAVCIRYTAECYADTAGAAVSVWPYLDGLALAPTVNLASAAGAANLLFTHAGGCTVGGLAPGPHTFEFRHSVSNGTVHILNRLTEAQLLG